MILEIKKIQLNGLEDFVKSKMFQNFEYVPISPIRAKSYLNNPNARQDDVVLYLGFIKNRLVAFRSLFAGTVNSENKQTRIGWCSGNWVHPNYRRNGFSEQLLKEAYADWNQKLLFTNYAPNSEKLYLKTGWFQSFHQFDGVRGYLFPKSKKLVEIASKNVFFKIIFSIIDYFISRFTTIRLFFFKASSNPKIKFEIREFPDDECYNLLRKRSSNHIFNRGEQELKWIMNNPWISDTTDGLIKKYPFSLFSKSFFYKTVKVFSQDDFSGFFIFSIREGHLKTLYFCLPDSFAKEVAPFLKNYCVQNKVETITIYKKGLANELFNRKFPFLYVKKYGQKIYCTFKIENEDHFEFQDGDGDVIFT